MKTEYRNMAIATAAGAAVGLLGLMLAIPTLLGMIVGNDLHTVFNISRETGWGLAMGLMHSVPAAIVAARVALRRGTHRLRRHILLAIGVAMSVGTIAGVSTTTALWMLKPLRVSPQGPSVLHIANFTGIVIAALCSAVAVTLVANRFSETIDATVPIKTRRAFTQNALLWSLLLWSPLDVLSCVIWGSQPYWNPISFQTRQLQSANDYHRFLAIDTLNENHAYSPGVINAVAQSLNDYDSPVRGKALEYLVSAARHGKAEFELGEQLKESENQRIRDYAVQAIELTKYDFAADRKAAEQVLSMGGSVTVLTAESIREKVDQVSRLGSSPFQLVGMQFVDLPPLKADNLAIFSKLPMLSELKLLGTEITDDGLEQLKRLPALKRLTITRSHLTDDSLKYLAKMPALVYLLSLT